MPMTQVDYVHGHSESVVTAHAVRTAQDSAAYLLPHLRPGMDVLDVGCGPGSITVGLAAAVAPGRTVGIDASAEVLDTARETATAAGVPVTFQVADVMALPFADGSFDVVHAHQVLQHLGDPVGALRELRRVARPGGLLAVRDVDYSAITWHPASEGMTRWRETYLTIARGGGGEPDAGRRLLEWVLAAGIPGEDITAGAGVWSYTTPEQRRWLAEQWSQRVTASRFAERAVAAGLATPAELTQIAQAWLRWAEEPAGWFTMLHGQVLARV